MREVAHARKQNPVSDLDQILHGGRYPDVITRANFGEDRLWGFGVAGGQNLPFSIDFDRCPYNTVALPCERVIDMCTRFPECIPLRYISSSSVAEVLLGVFSRVGLPDRIHSDRGSQVTPEMMQELCRLLSVKQFTTSPYHATGNGLCENMNKIVKNLLNKVVSERPQDWSRPITPLMFALRDTPQDSTDFTTFKLLFGHRVRTPMTLLKHLWTGEKEDPEVKTAYQYVIDLRERIEETCQLAQEEIATVQKKNQTYYNKTARERKLNIGDSVLLLLPTENNKVTLVWRGLYEVLEKVGEVVYKSQSDT